MAPKRMTSLQQLEVLVTAIEENRHRVLNFRPTGPLEHREALKFWEDLASKLNSCASFGMAKTPSQWKRYWNLLKCRTKAKAADIRRRDPIAAASTRTVPLSDIENRIIIMVQNEALEGDGEVFLQETVSDEETMEMDPTPTTKENDYSEVWSRSSSPENGVPDHTDESQEEPEKKNVIRETESTTIQSGVRNVTDKQKLNGEISYKYHLKKSDYIKIKIQEEELHHQREIHRAQVQHQNDLHEEELRFKHEMHLQELKYKQEVHKEELKHKQDLHREELRMKIKEREYLVKNWEIGLQSSLRTANGSLKRHIEE